MCSLIASGLADDVAAGHPGVAGGRLHDRGQQPHGGGLARAVGPDQAEDLALGHAQRQPVHGGHVAERLGQAIGADGVHGDSAISFQLSAFSYQLSAAKSSALASAVRG